VLQPKKLLVFNGIGIEHTSSDLGGMSVNASCAASTTSSIIYDYHKG